MTIIDLPFVFIQRFFGKYYLKNTDKFYEIICINTGQKIENVI